MGFAIFFLVIVNFSVFVRTSNTAQENICHFQSLYQFGASKTDTGNAIRILPSGPTLAAARAPYGETFPGKPTGRWSDGRLTVDYFAKSLRLSLLNPYLNKNASFNNGVNFAVAGATTLDSSFFTERNIMVSPEIPSLTVQLGWFRTYLSSICSTQADCAEKLKRAIFFVGEIGGNDIRFALSQRKSFQEIETYVPLITQGIINATREVIGAGAIRAVVPGNFPIGCFPLFLRLLPSNDSSAYDDFGCLKSVNNLAIFQNNNLQKALNTLKKEFPNVVIVYADYYNAFLSVLRRAHVLGFDIKNLLKVCCGAQGQSNPVSSGICGNPGAPVCPDPNRYLHWDGLHLTQEANRRISKIIVKKILLNMRCIP